VEAGFVACCPPPLLMHSVLYAAPTHLMCISSIDRQQASQGGRTLTHDPHAPRPRADEGFPWSFRQYAPEGVTEAEPLDFFLGVGPMFGDWLEPFIRNVMTRLRGLDPAWDTRVHYLDLAPPYPGPFFYGCDEHPAAGTHQTVYYQAQRLVSSVLGW
jgi:hypothetical protein